MLLFHWTRIYIILRAQTVTDIQSVNTKVYYQERNSFELKKLHHKTSATLQSGTFTEKRNGTLFSSSPASGLTTACQAASWKEVWVLNYSQKMLPQSGVRQPYRVRILTSTKDRNTAISHLVRSLYTRIPYFQAGEPSPHIVEDTYMSNLG